MRDPRAVRLSVSDVANPSAQHQQRAGKPICTKPTKAGANIQTVAFGKMDTNEQDAYISYSPMNYMSVQSMRERGVEMAWLKLEFFLRQFTTANPEYPDDSQWDSIELSIFNGFNNQNTEDKCWRAIDIANKKLGDGQVINVQKPEFYKNPPKKQTIWRLKKENFKSIVDLLIEGDPWPAQEKGLGPVELVAFYKFYLKDYRTKEILPRQTFESSILIWLTRNSFCTPTLNFPFAQPDNDFWNYIKTMESYLPFKLEPKYLRLLKKNKKGRHCPIKCVSVASK